MKKSLMENFIFLCSVHFFISLAINYVVSLQILKEELGMGCHTLLQDD